MKLFFTKKMIFLSTSYLCTTINHTWSLLFACELFSYVFELSDGFLCVLNILYCISSLICASFDRQMFFLQICP